MSCAISPLTLNNTRVYACRTHRRTFTAWGTPSSCPTGAFQIALSRGPDE